MGAKQDINTVNKLFLHLELINICTARDRIYIYLLYLILLKRFPREHVKSCLVVVVFDTHTHTEEGEKTVTNILIDWILE